MENHSSDKSTDAVRIAFIASVLAILLAVAKLVLFFMSGSMIVALSAFDSAVDATISFINKKVLKLSGEKADENHPYGHGKAESIAALGQGVLIVGGSILIMGSSISQFISGDFEKNKLGEMDWYLIFFFLVAAFISIGIARLLYSHGSRHNSPALIADSEHYKVDFISNIGNAVAFLLIMMTGEKWLDPIVAALTGGFMINGGWSLVKTSVDELMDHDITKDVKKNAIETIYSVSDQIVDVHKLRGRRSGQRYLLDFHITLPAKLSFEEVHDIVEEIEETLSEKLQADAVVHADPDSLG